jgi:NitT/TauT family transport system substrate-binding protein
VLKRAMLHLILACAILGAAGGAGAQSLRVGTPEATGLSFGLFDLGQQAGIFTHHGIQAERLDFAGAAKTHAGLAAGSVDLILGNGVDLVFPIKGVPELAVAAWQSAPDELVVLVRPEVHELSELKGRTIGIAGPGGLTQWVAQAASRHAGWGPNGMRQVSLGAINTMVAALLARNVDATVASLAYGTTLEEQGRARVLLVGGQVSGPFIAHVVFASTDMMQNHADQLRRFLAAWFEVLAYAKTHKDAASALLAPKIGISPTIFSRVYDILMPSILPDGHFDRAGFATVKQSLVDLEQVKPEDMPPDNRLITEAFLPP